MDALVVLLSNPKLGVKDIRRLALTNKEWGKAARNEQLWLRLYFSKLVGIKELDKMNFVEARDYIAKRLSRTVEYRLWNAMRIGDGTPEGPVNGYHLFMAFCYRAILLGLQPQVGFFAWLRGKEKTGEVTFRGTATDTTSKEVIEARITIRRVLSYEDARSIQVQVPSRIAVTFEQDVMRVLPKHHRVAINRPRYDVTTDTYSEDTFYQMTPDSVLKFLELLFYYDWAPEIEGTTLWPLQNCLICGNIADKQCGGECNKAFYCGQVCANIHWEAGHSNDCK